MQLEVILPLVAYLVVVFGISVYAMRKRSTGSCMHSDKFQQAGTPVYFAPECQC